MTASATTICNQALDALGKRQLTTLGSDGTYEDDLCNNAYPEERDKVLREHPWNVSTKRTVLGENLLLQSQALATTWTATNATASNDNARAPDGTTTATLLTDADAGNAGTIAQAVTVPNDDKQYTLSVYLKQGTAAVTRLLLAFSGGSSGASQAVDITWAATPTVSAGTLESVGGGWWRFHVTLANVADGSTTLTVTIYPAGATASAQGTVYAWGAQLSQNDAKIGYAATTTAAVQPTFPPFGFKYGWPLPVDCLAFLDVNDGDQNYKLEDGYLLYDGAEAPIRYEYQNTDPTTFDPLLQELIGLRLAWRLAIPLGASDERKSLIKDLLTEAEDKAATRDSQEDGEDAYVEDDWITARHSGWTPGQR